MARLVILVMVLGFPGPAMAYVDPGTGMLLWQGLIAFIGGVIVFVSHPIRTIRNLIHRIRGK